METLYEIGLTNALVVAVIAPVALLIGRTARARPAWVHAIWVLVLLKFVTPPIAGVPVGWSRAVAVNSIPEIEAPVEVDVESPELPDIADAPRVAAQPRDKLPTPRPKSWQWPSWTALLGAIWLGGSISWSLLASWRIARFARVMKRADPAPEEIASWVASLAEQIGLAKPPRVVIAPGRLSPMVWALGVRACLVIPEDLWVRLDDSQRSAMLVHELAHLRRKDHWVRVLELLAIGLFWWHPALWLARRELHRAEELCCDSWVVWALPQAKKNYAAALVEAVEFLSESRPRKLPVGASGMGQVEDLSRRIGMILRGDAPRGLGRFGSVAVVGLALMLLPWKPTLGRPQDAPLKSDVPGLAKTAQDEDGKTKNALDIPDDLAQRIQALFDKYETLRKAKNLTEVERLEMEKLSDRLKWSSEMLKKRYVPKNTVLSDMLQLAQAQEKVAKDSDTKPNVGAKDDDDFATGKYSAAYQRAAAEYKYARATEARLAQLLSVNAVEARVVEAARDQTSAAKARLDEIARRDQIVEEDQELALLAAQDAIETAKGKLKVQKAQVAKAAAQRDLASAEHANVVKLKMGNVVSADEVNKAKGEYQVKEAMYQQEMAELEQVETEIAQAQRRYEVLKKRQTAYKKSTEPADVKKAPVETVSGPPYPDSKIMELEKKLDRVIQELEQMRKGKDDAKPKNAPPAKPATSNKQKFLGLTWDSTVKDETLVETIYRTFLHRKPTEAEMVHGLAIFDDAPNQHNAVYTLVLKLTPSFSFQQGREEEFAQAIANPKDFTDEQVIELVFLKIMNRYATSGETRRWTYDFKQAPDRGQVIDRFVKEIATLYREGTNPTQKP